jgi:2-methylisocitrate lyase-like PEP mutase family enzyme
VLSSRLTQEHQLEETLERVALYEKNGANGIFVPLMSEKNDIKSLLSRTTLPHEKILKISII